MARIPIAEMQLCGNPLEKTIREPLNGDFGIEVVRLFLSAKANLHLNCRIPGHYERPEEVFEGIVLEYALRFPGVANRTLEELGRASEQGH